MLLLQNCVKRVADRDQARAIGGGVRGTGEKLGKGDGGWGKRSAPSTTTTSADTGVGVRTAADGSRSPPPVIWSQKHGAPGGTAGT